MGLPAELLMLHDEHFIDDDELMLLHDVATRRREIDHRRYARFSVLNYNDEECLGNFRFKQNDLIDLVETLALPYELICPNGTKTAMLPLPVLRFSSNVWTCD